MDASATTQISRLRELDLDGLRAEYEKAFGKKTASRNREWLWRTVARKIQDGTEPPKSGVVLTAKFERKAKTRSRNVTKTAGTKKAKGEKKTRVRAIGERDPRLPKPGTTLSREWHGKKYLVKVLDQGFEYGGKPFRSLSAVAKAISGQIVNGYAWFSLIPKEDAKK